MNTNLHTIVGKIEKLLESHIPVYEDSFEYNIPQSGDFPEFGVVISGTQVKLGLTGKFSPKLIPLLTQIDNLTHLDLSYSNISTVPSFIRGFSQLQRLRLSYNKISRLPDWFREMGHLEFDLSGNPLKSPYDTLISLSSPEIAHSLQQKEQLIPRICNYLESGIFYNIEDWVYRSLEVWHRELETTFSNALEGFDLVKIAREQLMLTGKIPGIFYYFPPGHIALLVNSLIQSFDEDALAPLIIRYNKILVNTTSGKIYL